MLNNSTPAQASPKPIPAHLFNAKTASLAGKLGVEKKRLKRLQQGDVSTLIRSVILRALERGDTRVALALAEQLGVMRADAKIEPELGLDVGATLLAGTNPSSREAPAPIENVIHAGANFSQRLEVLENKVDTLCATLDKLVARLDAK